MNDRITSLLNRTFDKEQKKFRRDVDWEPLLERFVADGVDDETRARIGLEEMLKAETPAFLEGETIAFLRTVKQIPDLHSDEEMSARKAAGTAFGEKGVVFNLTADFDPTIRDGLDARIAEMEARLARAKAERDDAGVNFLENAILSAKAVLELVERYRQAAEKMGLTTIAKTLAQVPAKGARTFHEALQSLRILHYAMWCEGEYHCGLGRIDQYLLPYYEADVQAGRLTDETALEEMQEFFIACNRDSDLYIGVQQGDNGQSVMLGGRTRAAAGGGCAFNALSRLCLKACGELKLVDPKINLRVDKQTPLDIYELGTALTKEGLGFPQYANDDVVVPALVKWGYDPEDALDYSVAACWEFLIPGCGMDINNIDAVSFVGSLDTALRQVAESARTFEDVVRAFEEEVQRRADALVEKYAHVEILPGPFVSVISTGCIKKARDISQGAKYNNFGIHGTGIAVTVDSLASVRELVFERKLVSLTELVGLLDTDYAGRPDVLAAAKAAPKMGNADPKADEIAKRLIAFWGGAFDGKKNDRGGIIRPGTGSAMYYIWHAREVPASADGRLKGHPLSANYAPSLDVPVKGPVSVVRSFTEPELGPVCNGGPLTIELHDSAFLFSDGVAKVAHLVKFFVDRGGHQLQINTINRETLLDAQKHPENHRHLIVRVWGWSGYFVELDACYQDQIIRRVELGGVEA
ncbi:MAG: pyruvate formate lyase family protein [Kiritimatiellae bacterium]|nr:pyruvate formate lyase family protein [Kiritimatiellia bacterium]